MMICRETVLRDNRKYLAAIALLAVIVALSLPEDPESALLRPYGRANDPQYNRTMTEMPLFSGPLVHKTSYQTATFVIENNETHTVAYDEGDQIAFSGVDAATVINSAIGSTISRGGGKIVITSSLRTYEIKTPLKIRGSNLELEGKSGAVLIAAADIDSILRVCSESGEVVKNITIAGLTFDGNNTLVTDPFCGLVYVLNAENIFIDNVEATKSGLREDYAGIEWIPQAAINARNVRGLWIGNCYVHDNMGGGIVARYLGEGSTEEVYIVNNTIVRSNMINAVGSFGALSIAASNFSIVNNYICRAPFGVGIAGNTTRNGYIFGNIFIGNSGDEQIAESGIEVWNEGASFIQIKNNHFSRWCYGIGGGGIGIELGNTYSEYVGEGVHHSEIAYNTIDCSGYPSNMGTWGITIHGCYNKVYNNTILDPNPQNEAILEISPSEFNEIHDNEVLSVGERTPGDVTGDGVVNIIDLHNIGIHWYLGPPANASNYDVFADFNRDGLVNTSDLQILRDNWGL